MNLENQKENEHAVYLLKPQGKARKGLRGTKPN